MTAQGRILSASLWSILGETCVAGTGVVSFFVYAAFLSPSDFGIVAFCLVWTSLFQLLVDNSLRYAVVRYQDADHATFDVAFRGNVALALVSYLLVAGAAAPAAAILHDQRVLLVLPIMGLQLLCSGLSATHLAIAQRRFEFRTLFNIRLSSAIGSFGLGVALALAGFAYWSLVAASLAGGLIQLAGSWRAVQWRPGRTFSWVVASPLYRFAGWTAADMAMTWAAMWSGGFVLGCFRGEHELGLYRLSEQAAGAAIGTVVDPLNPVFYTAYSQNLNVPVETQRLADFFGRAVALLALPLTGILVLAAGPLEAALSVKWHGLAQLMILSAFARLAFSVAMPLIPYLRATGHPRAVAALRVILVGCQVPVFLLTAPLGVKALLIGALCLETAIYFVYFFAVHRITGMPVVRLMYRQGIALVAASCGGLVASLIGEWLATGRLERLLISIGFFIMWFIAFALVAERRLVAELWRDRARWVGRSPLALGE